MFGTKKINYKVGDVVVYSAFGGELRRVRVECKERDIKNGRPGFDGVVLDSEGKPKTGVDHGVWGYDDQIVRVERA